MSTDRTCNSSFWTKEEGKIQENTLAIYSRDKDLFTKMEEALPGKSRSDIINHYNILTEDVEPMNSGRVPSPNFPEVYSDSNQNSRGRMAKRGFLDRIETQTINQKSSSGTTKASRRVYENGHGTLENGTITHGTRNFQYTNRGPKFLNALVANLESLSQDVARVNAGLDKL
ncbi:hypothetical protein FXO38_27094 [Capsicum annuum]|nr:hypothetical protein FXO38_27094 [Capsicum annuum]KAF3667502.1 hypothetical protein FXO37_10005 [Capsicum annuum]